MRRILAMLVVVFSVSCTGDSGDDCAFQAQDGSCAVAVSEDGSLECKLDNAALCATTLSFLEQGETSLGGSSAALISRGGGGGGGLGLVCEPDGTFMCNCCDVKLGCFPCPTPPKKDPVFSGALLDATDARELKLQAADADSRSIAP